MGYSVGPPMAMLCRNAFSTIGRRWKVILWKKTLKRTRSLQRPESEKDFPNLFPHSTDFWINCKTKSLTKSARPVFATCLVSWGRFRAPGPSKIGSGRTSVLGKLSRLPRPTRRKSLSVGVLGRDGRPGVRAECVLGVFPLVSASRGSFLAPGPYTN